MSRKLLEHRIKALNKLLDRPDVSTRITDDGRGWIGNVGCIFLEHNTHYGYKIVEMVSRSCGERTITEGLTLKAVTQWVSGAYWMHQEINKEHHHANRRT